jgi:hypothetical protein
MVVEAALLPARVSQKGGVPIPREVLEELQNDEKKGWYTSAYHSCFEDKHLALICKHLFNKYKVNGESWDPLIPVIPPASSIQHHSTQDSELTRVGSASAAQSVASAVRMHCLF